MRARLKRVDELDPRWICCESFRDTVNAEAGKIVTIDPEVCYCDVRCQWCKREFTNVPFRRLVAGELRVDLLEGRTVDCTLIAVPFVDLDEGEGGFR